MSIIEAHDLRVVYGSGRQQTPALNGVSLTVGAEAVAVMGPSGCGKSSLVHCLSGVLSPSSGQVILRTRTGEVTVNQLSDAGRTRLRRGTIGVVFQAGELVDELPVVENVALPLLLDGVPRAEAAGRAEAWLQRLGLGGLGTRRPGELSGGQMQRVAIARALVGSPAAVFADEPTGALDQATGAEVMAALVGATREAGAALVVVTHDPTVAGWCHRVVRMRDGIVTGDDRQAPQPVVRPADVTQSGAPRAWDAGRQ